MNGKNKAIIFVLLIVFFVAGVLFANTFEHLFRSFVHRADITNYQQLPIDRCLANQEDDFRGCLDELIAAEAVKKSDRLLCDDIENEAIQNECLETIDLVAQLDDKAVIYCAGSSDMDACRQILLLQKAAESQNSEICGDIAIKSLATSCQSLVLTTDAGQPVTGPGTFGPDCNRSSEFCQNVLSSYREALLQGNRQACMDALGFEADCLRELAIYQVYTSGNVQGCDAYPVSVNNDAELSQGNEISNIECRAEVAQALAYDAGDTAICNTLAEDFLREGCIEEVGLQTVSRFAYLQQ